MMISRIGRRLGWALCAALLASGAWAQSKTTAALTGTVTDNTRVKCEDDSATPPTEPTDPTAASSGHSGPER